MPKYKNDGYPRCIYKERGKFWYIKGGTRIHKWDTEEAMWEGYRSIVATGKPGGRMAKGIERFIQEEIPKNSEDWQKKQLKIMDNIGNAFIKLDPDDLKPPMIQDFLAIIAEKSLATAKQHRATFKVFLDYLMLWGLMTLKPNPVSLTKLDVLESRDRDVAPHEFWPVFKIARDQLKVAMLLARGTGMREMDILTKLVTDVTEVTVDGEVRHHIQNEQRKRKKGAKRVKQIFESNAYIEAALMISEHLRKKYSSLYLIPTVNRTPYTRSGFTSVWADLMDEAVKKGLIAEKFTFHDVRGMTGSEQEDVYETSKLLGNTVAAAKRHYRRRPEIVQNKAAPKNIEDVEELMEVVSGI